jgi:hypothetical protein
VLGVIALVASGCVKPGIHRVGQLPSPGLWHTLGGNGCYWARLSGFSGSLGEIIANDFSSGGPRWVEIESTDAGFETDGCVPWWKEPGPFSRPLARRNQPFGPGDYKLGFEIASGHYASNGGPDCYWERLAGFHGTLDDIIANHIGGGYQVVTLELTDVGFSSDGCGNWYKLN